MTRSTSNANIRGHPWWIPDTIYDLVNKVMLKKSILYFQLDGVRGKKGMADFSEITFYAP
jgi:hypothetical protein